MNYLPDLVFIFGYAALSFAIAFMMTPFVIRMLVRFGFVKQMREESMDGKATPIFLKHHKHKSGTPNGGGVVIWGTVVAVILISRVLSFFGVGYFLELDSAMHSILSKSETWLPFATLVVTALFGGLDDYLNTKGAGKVKGIKAKPKFIWLTIFALVGAWWFHYKLGWSSIHIPRIGDFEIGFWYIPLFTFVIITCAHAVNISDGLDGLSGGLSAIAFAAFAIIAYSRVNPSLGTDHMVFLAAFCAVIVGALVAFLWFNVNPAKLFMGDTGALALGATLGVVAMLTNALIALLIIGLVFFLELASSGIQLLSKKYLGKKVFKAAPYHHNLQAEGHSEANIVMRMWIIGSVLAVIGVIVALVGAGL